MNTFAQASLVTLTVTLGIFASLQQSRAAVLAFDNANQTAYDNGWQNGDDGGSGFEPWTLDGSLGGTGGQYGHFIGSSSGIDVGGESFGMFGNGHANAFAGAARIFSDGGLDAGQQFSFAISVNFRNGNKGFDLRNSDGAAIWNFNVGGDAYRVNGSSIFADAYDANTVFSFSFTQNASTLDYTITRSGGLSGTFSGSSFIAEDTFAGIRFYVAGTDAGAPNDLYFNSLTAVPEPTTMALGAFGVLLLAGRVWRHFRPSRSASSRG